jgi:hypothetical protein
MPVVNQLWVATEAAPAFSSSGAFDRVEVYVNDILQRTGSATSLVVVIG